MLCSTFSLISKTVPSIFYSISTDLCEPSKKRVSNSWIFSLLYWWCLVLVLVRSSMPRAITAWLLNRTLNPRMLWGDRIWNKFMMSTWFRLHKSLITLQTRVWYKSRGQMEFTISTWPHSHALQQICYYDWVLHH